jgi:hypothetical protein
MKDVLLTFLILLISICSGIAQNNYGSLKPERVYLHTDRAIFMAGDYLFYTLYLQGNPGQMSKYAYFVLRGQPNSLISDFRLEINNQVAYGSMYLPDTLRSGIYQVVCYTNCMRNEDEKSYFYKEIIIVNRFDKELELFKDQHPGNTSDILTGQRTDSTIGSENVVIHLNKQAFNPREKVVFSIETINIPEENLARLSVSISEIIPGIPMEPSISQYFSEHNNYKNGGKLTENHCLYHPEIHGTVLQGNVVSMQQRNNHKNTINNTVLISCADSLVNMQYTTTDSLGSFSFLLNPFYDNKELFIRLKENSQEVIELDNKFNVIQLFFPSTLFKQPGIRNYLVRSRNIFEVNKNYGIQTVIHTQKEFPSATTIPRVYYNPNFTIIPADFLELPDFVEISRELLPMSKVRKNNRNYIFSFAGAMNKNRADTVPAIFLDGVPIDDVNQIIDLGSGDIKRIDVLPVVRYFGEMSFAGILSVFSKDAEINTLQFKNPTIRYQSLSSQSYTKPEHFNPLNNNKYFPDLRQVLLWEPDIILKSNEKKQIECYASDLQGKYLINIQGITSTGIPVNAHEIITIQRN